MTKVTIYHNLKKELADSEKAYDKALEKFEGLITAINRNLINNTPNNNNGLIPLVKVYCADLITANLRFLVANKKFHNFMESGEVTL